MVEVYASPNKKININNIAHNIITKNLGSKTVWWRTLSSLSTMKTELAGKPVSN